MVGAPTGAAPHGPRGPAAARPPEAGAPSAGEVLSRYLHAQAGDFLRSLRLHGESGSDAEEAAEAARLLRRSARRISGALLVYQPLTDQPWADELRAELAWLAGLLAREHAYAARLSRLRGALHRLSGAVGADQDAGVAAPGVSAAPVARGGVTAEIGDGGSAEPAPADGSTATGPGARRGGTRASVPGARTSRGRRGVSLAADDGEPDGRAGGTGRGGGRTDRGAEAGAAGRAGAPGLGGDARGSAGDPTGTGRLAAGAGGAGPSVPGGKEGPGGDATRSAGAGGRHGTGRGAVGGRGTGGALGGPREESRGGTLTVGAARAGALLERQLTLARTRAHTAALQALGSSRFHAVADAVALLASEVPLAPGVAERPAGQELPPLAELAHRRLVEAVEALPLGVAGHPYNADALAYGLAATAAADAPPASERQDAPWHQVRRLVRLRRYALEVLDEGERVDPAGPVEAEPSLAVRLLAAAQALDRHRDAAEAAAAAASAARTPRIAPATAYALGVLHADQRQDVEAARFAFGRVWQRLAAGAPAW
ncbi:CHAD domain-containing protein [Streptomyces sp. LX-29]|nr:CHAD domain-containing protein [Streptomyces sp. LX-29]WFB11708.1 CHAD domain-containing protein [Streptomyces sp. LX-29]